MNICIIGTGASGWIASTILKKIDFIKKITIIGSSKIPSVGVGESTTLMFLNDFLNQIELNQFVRETDASVKYGVYYDNWSKKNFIHHFKGINDMLRTIDLKIDSTLDWGELLANKDPDVHIHDLIGDKLWKFIHQNEVSLDFDEHTHSWHFDAGKFIKFLKKINLEDDKVNFIDDTIIDCKFSQDGSIKNIIGESNKKYTADYFVNCCGDNELNEKVFKEEYITLSPYLLTNKALVYPLNYKDKRKQFHPYTIARTLRHGWRWITPTQSRIGTGYVFSDNHISIDEATNEFLEDIGDRTIEPQIVNFNPKVNASPFKINSCTIGMSSGFLEPLDAPGLDITIKQIKILIELLNCECSIDKINSSNANIGSEYQWWCAFILHQYKTCWRTDSQFWIDHKNVECKFYDQIIEQMGDTSKSLYEKKEYMMFYQTTAGKDIQWKSRVKDKPFSIGNGDTKTIHHLDYIQSFYD